VNQFAGNIIVEIITDDNYNNAISGVGGISEIVPEYDDCSISSPWVFLDGIAIPPASRITGFQWGQSRLNKPRKKV
jgi:hypothetical protein